MTMSKKDAGIALVMLQRLNEQHLPFALELKARMEKGELLTDYDLEYLKRFAEEARFIPALLIRQPQFEPLANQVFSLFAQISAKGFENERTRTKER